MNLKQTAILLLVLLGGTAVAAQEKPSRRQTYFPERGDIVCVNGQNRYTRALYGGYTLFRLETSDRPLFATYNRAKSRNFRFWLALPALRKGDRETFVRLDSTTYCEARYRGGLRTYRLRHDRWPGGEVEVTALASRFTEGALWHIVAKGFPKGVRLRVAMAPVAKPKMAREGDLGIEPSDSYEPDPKAVPTVLETLCKGSATLLLEDNDRLAWLSEPMAAERRQREETALNNIASTLQFTTPDPYINTLGANLSVAADGLWDGQTWLHGCIGWRMPLAGWRAGYLGDVMGWNDRAVKHFNAYAASQVTEVEPVIPHPSQDPEQGFTRALKKWGTQMYSNGYICRNPNRNDVMHHYDMNLNFIDELLWHFCYDADTVYMRKMWPVITRHLAWEKRNFDPDGDHLYDAYCCIWASDALWYNGGAVTHSSAYNYRGNLLAARIADLLGENSEPYRREAEAILQAMNHRLWLEKEGHWAEFQDAMGTKRLHKSAALWSIYTPIDCGVTTPEQAWRSTLYVDRDIPHIPVRIEGQPESKERYTLSTTNWLPYDWSTNNVAHEEVMNTALAYFKAGRNEEGFHLLKSDILDGMFLGKSPGNFGQISYYDKARSEAYRDFGDNVGISARALVNGLFGVTPDALNRRCVIQPGFPAEWDSVTFRSPYLTYRFHREGTLDVYDIEQHFSRPLNMVIRTGSGGGVFTETEGSSATRQRIVVNRAELPEGKTFAPLAPALSGQDTPEYLRAMGLEEPSVGADAKAAQRLVSLDKVYNARVSDIFKNEYRSPRSPYTTLQIGIHGIGQWCHPGRMAEIDDSGLRQRIVNGVFDTGVGVRFALPKEGNNIAYTTLWDNYPDSVSVPLKGNASCAYLLLAGSTNNMQSRIANAVITVTYRDGSIDMLSLENPVNYCPIEQDYFADGLAFKVAAVRPYRVHLGSGLTSRNLGEALTVGSMGRSLADNPDSAEPCYIPQGAALLLKMPLDKHKKLKQLTLRTLSNDVVTGLMGITLQ